MQRLRFLQSGIFLLFIRVLKQTAAEHFLIDFLNFFLRCSGKQRSVQTFQIGKHFYRRFLLDTHFGLSALVLIIALVIGLCVFRRRKDW